MGKRSDLQKELIKALGSSSVWYQPPETVKLTYPCIVYEKSNMPQRYANDKSYFGTTRYSVTVISRDADNEIASDLLGRFEYCSFNRRYVADGLYHDALDLFY